MATVREGHKLALIVVDTQVGVLNRAWDTARIVANVARAVQRARAHAVPVLWVQHADSEMAAGSPQWQLVPELVPQEGEPIVHKQYESSFENTTLEAELARLGVSHVVLAGAMTNWCIRATAYGALDRGYDMTLVKDAHTTGTVELDDGFKIEAEKIVQDLNLVMRWLSYPGRKAGTATAEALDFGAAA
ncbi:MAG: isochorismatase family protein [Rubrivivax sp.]